MASIDSDEPPTFPKILGREQKEAGAVLADLPNEVRINNELSDECAVVEVFTVDRRGLLYRLARALHDLGLVIRFSKISTYLDQVVDVFYVTERDGEKPPERRAAGRNPRRADGGHLRRQAKVSSVEGLGRSPASPMDRLSRLKSVG